jgi:hypothetical protein
VNAVGLETWTPALHGAPHAPCSSGRRQASRADPRGRARYMPQGQMHVSNASSSGPRRRCKAGARMTGCGRLWALGRGQRWRAEERRCDGPRVRALFSSGEASAFADRSFASSHHHFTRTIRHRHALAQASHTTFHCLFCQLVSIFEEQEHLHCARECEITPPRSDRDVRTTPVVPRSCDL